MRLPWGGLETQAVGAWDRLAAAGPRAGRGTVDHQPRDPGDRLAGAGRPRARARFGDGAEVHLVLSVRDLVRQIPAEWQENVKHRRDGQLPPVPRQDPRPARAASWIAPWFWGVQEVPDILDRWGRDLPPERVHLVTVPPPGRRRDLLWKRFAAVFGLDAASLDLDDRARQPVARRPRDRADPPDQPARSTTACSPARTTGRWSASCSPTRPCRSAPARPRLGAAARRARLGGRALDGAWIERDREPRVRRGRRPRRPAARRPSASTYADPDQPRRGDVAGAAVRRDHGAAARERPAAREVEQRRCAASSTRRSAGSSSGRLRPSYRAARAGWCRDRRRQPASRPPAAGGLPAGAGQELAVGVAPDLPGGVAVGARADQAADDRDPAARPSWPAACRRPW